MTGIGFDFGFSQTSQAIYNIVHTSWVIILCVPAMNATIDKPTKISTKVDRRLTSQYLGLTANILHLDKITMMIATMINSNRTRPKTITGNKAFIDIYKKCVNTDSGRMFFRYLTMF